MQDESGIANLTREAVQPLLPALQVEVLARLPETLRHLREAQRHAAFGRMRWKYRPMTLRDAVGFYAAERSPDLLIIEHCEDKDDLPSLLTALARECREGTRVMLISDLGATDVPLLRQVFKLGVSDCLRSPMGAEQVAAAIHELARDFTTTRLGRVTAFIGAGGGTGSSTIAQNVAAAMSLLDGTEVVLADLDTQYGTVGLSHDVGDAYTITDVVRRRSPIDDVLMERILTRVDDRLSLLLVEPGVENAASLPIPAINAILDLANLTPRHVLLDMPHGWGLRSRNTIVHADHLVVTALPTLVGLRNARMLFDGLRRVRAGAPDPRLVLNKTRAKGQVEVPEAEFRTLLGLDHLCVIPFDPKLFGEAQIAGQSVIYKDERHRISRTLIDLARRLNGGLEQGDPRGPLQKLSATLRKWW